MDLLKAFNYIDCDILLAKLPSYDITARPLHWIQSYLTTRQQKVKVNNETSAPLYTNSGMPQGSVLGPIIFLLYTNDIFSLIDNKQVQLILYADDATCLIKAQDFNTGTVLTKEFLCKIRLGYQANKIKQLKKIYIILSFHKSKPSHNTASHKLIIFWKSATLQTFGSQSGWKITMEKSHHFCIF